MDFKILADDSTLEGTNIRTFFEHFHECSVKAGFKYPNDQSLAAVLRNAGFEDVKVWFLLSFVFQILIRALLDLCVQATVGSLAKRPNNEEDRSYG
jgi:hypothetical protein